jgi:quinol monooxygenase YgiN
MHLSHIGRTLWSIPGKLLVLLFPVLSGCAISTPYPQIEKGNGMADEKVVLVLSRIVVDTSRRDEFDRQTRLVIDSMPQHRGLIGYSARRELLGNTAWTMSVWESDQARADFVNSAVHERAIAKSRPAMKTVEFKRLTVERKDVPASWKEALAMLEDPAGIRNYWD